jgi:catechol 2,3-dioxygenase-like lactoylglutathione lyase family enzyme
MRTAATIFLLTGLSVSACSHSEETAPVDPTREYGITASNAFFYYHDLARAVEFYTRTLGLRVVADYGSAKILQVASTSYLTLVDGTAGMHTPDEPKSVALALITDQLDEWYSYLRTQDVEVLHDYTPVAGRPHHGFVVLDPEGYYLEFERFNEHPENERFLPLLAPLPTLTAAPDQDTSVPPGLGFKATVLWLYYRDCDAIRRFYASALGLEEVVDQGWAWIHAASPSGFIGPVDETRGMHDWTEQKAVTVSFLTDDLEGWFAHARRTGVFELRHDAIQSDDDGRFRAFVGYDPEGYYLEFDTFLPHPLNRRLLRALER